MTTAAVTATAQPPRLVPTASQPVRIPWGDWAEQILVHETTLLESAAEAGVQLVASVTPMGGLVAGLVGPIVVKQLVDQGLALAEGMLKGQAINIVEPNWIESYVLNTINAQAPNLAIKMGDTLNPIIKAAIVKATPPETPAPSKWLGAPNAI